MFVLPTFLVLIGELVHFFAHRTPLDCFPETIYRQYNHDPVTMMEPRGDGITLLLVTSVLLALSWVTVAARLSVRRWLKPEAMGLDDLLMCAGLVCFLPVPCFLDHPGRADLTASLDSILGHMLSSHCVCFLRRWAAPQSD